MYADAGLSAKASHSCWVCFGIQIAIYDLCGLSVNAFHLHESRHNAAAESLSDSVRFCPHGRPGDNLVEADPGFPIGGTLVYGRCLSQGR